MNVKPVRRALNGGGETAHLGQAYQVGLEEHRRAAAFRDLGDHLGASALVSAMDQHTRSRFAKPASDEAADTVG